MINSTQVSYFILGDYVDTGDFKYLCFLIILILYMLIICSNVLLVAVICLNRSLHEPMYLFLCSLFVNELCGSTALLPFLLIQILSDVHTISAPFCFLQTFCLYCYGCVEFGTLAIMAYDRHVAICFPLQYNTLMTYKKVLMLIAVVWIPSYVAVLIATCLMSSLQLCGNIIDRVYCDNFYVVRLACSDTTVVNIYGLVSSVYTMCLPFSLILFSYMKILKVCFSGSKQTRQKAVSTCTPHLVSLIDFSFWAFFDIVQSKIDANSLPFGNPSVIFLSCHPLFTPVLYGFNCSRLRLMCKDLLLRSVGKF